VNRRLFSLINQKKSLIETKHKIVPKEAIEQLLDAGGVLKAVQEDATRYKLDIAKECELLKEEAMQQGYADGYQKWTEEIVALEEEIAKVREEFEKMLMPVALKAAKKIVGREIELSKDVIVDIVANALKSVAQHKRVTIFVNKEDLDTLETNRSRLKSMFESLEVLSLREKDDIAKGGCVIETEGGIINARLENQWTALERAFYSLMLKSKDKPKETT